MSIPHTPPETENRRLLVVDDEPEIRHGYRLALTPQSAPHATSSRNKASIAAPDRASFEITEAKSGDEALEILQTELAAGRRFAGAIVDVRMPGKLDGLQFIREAWKYDPNLLVVVATAYQDRSVDEIDRIFSVQFQDQWDYLTKPFTAGEITQKARQLVSSWNRRERERAYVTRIREQQQTMIAQEKLAAIGRLARSVGHEFGNVLQPLMTKLEIARRKVDDALHPIFDEMIEATELGSHICQDLLTFAREGHETSAAPEIPVRGAVERALRILSHNIKRQDARTEVEVPEDLTVICHEPKLVQVFINLIGNSLDALPEGGLIRITASSGGPSSETRITVADSGSGIASDVQHLVFQPLFTTKGSHGNGIGLAVCKQIAEDYGGRIWLNSEPGKGTQVTLAFPDVPKPSS